MGLFSFGKEKREIAVLNKSLKDFGDMIIRLQIENSRLKFYNEFLGKLTQECDNKNSLFYIGSLNEKYVAFFVNDLVFQESFTIVGNISGSPKVVLKAFVDIDYNNAEAKLIDIYSYDQNCGIGSLGITAIARFAKARSCKKIIGTRESLGDEVLEKKLIHFYEKNGFVQSGKHIERLI